MLAAATRGNPPAAGGASKVNTPKVNTTHPAATPRIIRALTKPDTVLACHLDPVAGGSGADVDTSAGGNSADSLGWMGPFPIEGLGRSPGRDLALRIAMLVVDQSNYAPNRGGSDCSFSPRYALRYISATRDTADVLFGFNCSLLMVMTSDGKEGWMGDFSPVGAQLKEMVLPLLTPATRSAAGPPK